MAGPKYEVGIEFNATGTLKKTLAEMNAEMAKLAASAKMATAALAPVSTGKAYSQAIKASKALVTTQIQQEKIQAQQHKARASEITKEATAAKAQQALQAASQLQSLEVEEQKAAIRYREIKNSGAAQSKELRFQHAQRKFLDDKVKKEERLRTSRLAVARHAAAQAGRLTGGLGRDLLSNTVGMFFTPLTAAMALLTTTVIASADGLKKYDAALMSLRMTGMSDAASKAQLGHIINSGSNVSISSMASMQQYLSSWFPGSDVTKGPLGGTALGAAKLFQYMGYDKSQAAGTVEAQMASLNALYATKSYKDRQKIMATALSTEMSFASGMGFQSKQYLDTLNSLFGDVKTMPYLSGMMGSNKGMATVMQNIADEVRGGMNAGDIKALYGMQAGMSKSLVPSLMSMGKVVGLGNLQQVLGGNTFQIDKEAKNLLLTDPKGFVNRFMMPMLGYKGADVSKMSSDQLEAARTKATQYFGNMSDPGAQAMLSLMQSVMQNRQHVQQNKEWATLQNQYINATMTFSRAVDNFQQAIKSQTVITAINGLATAINAVSNIVSDPKKLAPRPIAGALPFTAIYGAEAALGLWHKMFGDTGTHKLPSASGKIDKQNINLHVTVHPDGHSTAKQSASPITRTSLAGGVNYSHSFTI